MKRTFEIFICDCPRCYEALHEIKAATCDNCTLEILDTVKDNIALNKSQNYGINEFPAVVFEGKVIECRNNGNFDIGVLKNLGLGNPY
ncbi:hypothetical protein BH10BAC5_BH10BAC5_26230 [soil metagenome]